MKKKVAALLLTFCTCFASIPTYAAIVPPPISKGDVNYDGSITLADAQLVLKYTLGTVTFEKMQIYLADYNEDGKVDSVDVDLILKKALKII